MATREREIYKVTFIGTAVNAVLIVLKLLAGIFGRSSAMLADAIHSLSDFITDVVVIAFVRIAGSPPTAATTTATVNTRPSAHSSSAFSSEWPASG